MRTFLNRLLLLLAALLLLAVGLGVLSGRLDLAHRWGVPALLGIRHPGDPLLGTTALDRWHSFARNTALLRGVCAGAAALALLWLAAQFSRYRTRRLRVATTRLHGSALSRAAQLEAERIDGVTAARAALRAKRSGTTLRLDLALERTAEPEKVLTALHGTVLAHARTAAEAPGLRLDVTLHSSRADSRGRAGRPPVD
ncbi:hypothetical protein [Streptacidiphilus cavernicola]|uniref:Alkaline shock response membrane anchor protein AmaP n=1 Tax=Streptacidiphilus cavernicola TaxID=3342716 RepID=A0ABV6VZ93_9ACTN